LTLSSDENTNKILEKYLEDLKREVGASEVKVGELKGEFKGKLEFKEKLVEIAFERIK